MPSVLMFFLIFGLVMMTAIVFAVWTCVRVIGLVFGALFGLNRKPPVAQPHVMATVSFCARVNCRASNPTHARFCHRCGNALAVGCGGPQSVRMRYVA
jgi:hypothetical protein